MAMLGSGDPPDRARGGRELQKLRDQGPAEREHANTRFRAALALGLLGDRRGLAILERYAEDPYKIGEHAVVLGDIGHPDGLETLVTLTKDPIPFVRAHATIALAQLGDQRGLAAVQRVATTGEKPRAGQVAGQALQMLNRILGS